MSVRAIKGGAYEFLTKPVESSALIGSIESALRLAQHNAARVKEHYALKQRHMSLTPREHEVLTLAISGMLNKQIAAEAQDSFITGDSVQIQQVLLNLVMNAVEAMAEVKDRSCTITISTSNAEGRVLVEIADTGSGIEPERLEKIFDSFYSTKAQGMPWQSWSGSWNA